MSGSSPPATLLLNMSRIATVVVVIVDARRIAVTDTAGEIAELARTFGRGRTRAKGTSR